MNKFVSLLKPLMPILLVVTYGSALIFCHSMAEKIIE
jgi:hypothetical protein